MAGTLTISTLSDGTNSTSSTNCIQGSAKAWVNFNGTGTVAIRAGFNVSSITDHGTGEYTLNFTTAMPDANYSIASTAGTPTTYYATFQIYNTAGTLPSTTSFRFQTAGSGWAVVDQTYVCIAVFR